MSLITSLYTGATGLEGNTVDLSVIGDNVANASTIGFKGSRAAFADLMADNLIGGGSGERGLGVRLQMIQKIPRAGRAHHHRAGHRPRHRGRRYVRGQGERQRPGRHLYTRAGQFTVDKDGLLVNLDGLRVQGYSADNTGKILTAAVGDLTVGSATAPPRPTGTVTIRANLQSDATAPAAFDIADPTGTSNFSTSVGVFDSLGKSHQVDVFFRKNGAGDWEWHALSDGGGLTGGTLGTPEEIAGWDGGLRRPGAPHRGDQRGRHVQSARGHQPATAHLRLRHAISPRTGLDGVTQFAAPSIHQLSQPGRGRLRRARPGEHRQQGAGGGWLHQW